MQKKGGKEMDIRMINKKDEIINVTNLSIKVSGRWLIGVNEEGKIMQIEEYEDEGEARKNLQTIWEVIENVTNGKQNPGAITIHT